MKRGPLTAVRTALPLCLRPLPAYDNPPARALAPSCRHEPLAAINFLSSPLWFRLLL